MRFELEQPVLRAIGQVAQKMGIKAYVVGGHVRDLLLNQLHHWNRETTDIDIVTEGDGIALAQAVAKSLPGRPKVSIYKTYGTAAFPYKGLSLEFVGARKESYRGESRNPTVEAGTLRDDQLRRDFTINAMSITLDPDDFGLLLDPFGGVDDLERRLIRTPQDPDITFSDDPLRMMRAIRFAAQLDFRIDPDCQRAIRQNAQRLDIVTIERVMVEFNKIMLAPVPSVGLYLLDDLELLGRFFPEMIALKGVESVNGRAHKDNFIHTLTVLDNTARKSDDLWLRWSALLHDIGKPKSKRFEAKQGWTFHSHEVIGANMVKPIFQRLRLPLKEPLRLVEKLVLLHLRPIVLSKEEVTDSAVRRILFDAGPDIEALMALCEADITSKNAAKVKRYMANFQLVRQKIKEIEEKDHLRNFQPPISGEEIMATFGLAPSKQVGLIKDAIKDAILEGAIGNNREEAWAFMLARAAEQGLSPLATGGVA